LFFVVIPWEGKTSIISGFLRIGTRFEFHGMQKLTRGDEKI